MCEILSSSYEFFSSFDDGVLQNKIEIVELLFYSILLKHTILKKHFTKSLQPWLNFLFLHLKLYSSRVFAIWYTRLPCIALLSHCNVDYNLLLWLIWQKSENSIMVICCQGHLQLFSPFTDFYLKKLKISVENESFSSCCIVWNY